MSAAPDRVLCPTVAVEARLGDRARPAGGRAPSRRYLFAVGTLEALEELRASATARLVARVGPLRCTEVAVEVAVGAEDVAALLADLEANRGQTRATLTPVATAVIHNKAALERAPHLGIGPVLVVASCGALTRQAGTGVWAC